MGHTKGKWKLLRGRNRYYEIPDDYHTMMQSCFYICGPKHHNDFVADLIVSNSPEGKANACLIAAAPDLLAACKAMAGECRNTGNLDEGQSIALMGIIDAITEAENEV